MIGLPGNLGNFDINELIAIFKNARDTGRTVLEEAVKALANNPQLKGIVEQLQGIFGKPIIELTDEELDNLIASWHSGLTKKSKPMKETPTPVPPIDETGNPNFKYFPTVLNKEEIEAALVASPRQMMKGAEIFGDGRTFETSDKFVVYAGVGESPRIHNWGKPLKIAP